MLANEEQVFCQVNGSGLPFEGQPSSDVLHHRRDSLQPQTFQDKLHIKPTCCEDCSEDEREERSLWELDDVIAPDAQEVLGFNFSRALALLHHCL